MRNPTIEEVERRGREVCDLRSASAILEWDQNTYLPEGGAEARGRQLSLLTRLAHERLTDPELGRLLERASKVASELDPDSRDARLVQQLQRDFRRATQIPNDFTGRMSEQQSATYVAWAKARPSGDFAAVRPALEKTLELSRELSSFFPGAEHPVDPLIEPSDSGMTVSVLRNLFSALRKELVPLVSAVLAKPEPDATCLTASLDETQQLAFGRKVIERMGYDFSRGRQDKTHHPFMTRFSHGDIRITTRVRENDLTEALFSTVHEAGHAMYEQGTAADLDGTVLGEGTSAGVHESQSRLWENIVGRSLAFWRYYYPELQAAFPQAFSNVSLDTFYRAINKVKRSLIRTDSDELTYNLHVMIRFDLECAMLEGSLAVRDLPEAWNERYRSDLGIVAPTAKDGCMQDVHWYTATIGGMFQCYTIGNILSAQFWEAAVSANPQIPGEIENGQFDTLRGWLVDSLYRHGKKYGAAEVVKRATGKELTIAPYMNYLRTKFGALYSL